MMTFYSRYWNLFRYSITVSQLRGEICTARLFLQGVDLFAPKFYLDRIVTLTILSTGKLDTVLPDGEDRILCVPSF